MHSHFTDEDNVFHFMSKGPHLFSTLLFGGLYLNVSLSKGQLKDIGYAAVTNSLSSWFVTNSQVAFFRNCQFFCFCFSVIGFSGVNAMSN